MPKQFTLSERDITPGTYLFDIDSPQRSNSATISFTVPTGWPAGPVFTYRISERERGTGLLTELVPQTVVNGGDGPVPPVGLTLSWPADKDKDNIVFDIIVHQTFRTAVDLRFDT